MIGARATSNDENLLTPKNSLVVEFLPRLFPGMSTVHT